MGDISPVVDVSVFQDLETQASCCSGLDWRDDSTLQPDSGRPYTSVSYHFDTRV